LPAFQCLQPFDDEAVGTANGGNWRQRRHPSWHCASAV
jgi:hypothetical protein